MQTFELFFNGKDEHWGDHEYEVAGWWCQKGLITSEPDHSFKWPICFEQVICKWHINVAITFSQAWCTISGKV